MTTQKHRDDAALGLSAADVVGSEAYQRAMHDLRQQITKQWEECPIRDAEGQRLLLQLMKITGKFESLLLGYIQSGKMAELKLDDMRDESPLKRAIRRIV